MKPVATPFNKLHNKINKIGVFHNNNWLAPLTNTNFTAGFLIEV
jgi:hypothetical protein